MIEPDRVRDDASRKTMPFQEGGIGVGFHPSFLQRKPQANNLTVPPEARVVIPPRANAVLKEGNGPPTQRDEHITMIASDGRMAWQAETGYGRRVLVENAIGRYKAIIGRRLRPQPGSRTAEFCPH
jgi:hypothetical protein